MNMHTSDPARFEPRRGRGNTERMIGSTAGTLLVATPPLADPNFDRSVVYMVEHDERGALGLVLNRPSDEDLPDQLDAWRDQLAAPGAVFTGGPVEPDTMIGVAHIVGDDPDWVGTVDLTRDPLTTGARRLRVFRGYAGWSPGQLDGELLAGAWIVLPAEPEDIFSAEPSELWRAVLRRQGGRLAWLATAADELSLN